MRILCLYTTREGQTEKVMQRLIATLSPTHQCDLVHLRPNSQIDLTRYQGVVIGTSIHYGYYPKLVKQFIEQYAEQLNQMPLNAFFGVNMVARKPHKNTPETNLYTRKFLATIAWQPKFKAVFAGALYYPRYNWFDKNMIRLIMCLSKGDTDITKPIIEYTDWHKVDDFAATLLNSTSNL